MRLFTAVMVGYVLACRALFLLSPKRLHRNLTSWGHQLLCMAVDSAVAVLGDSCVVHILMVPVLGGGKHPSFVLLAAGTRAECISFSSTAEVNRAGTSTKTCVVGMGSIFKNRRCVYWRLQFRPLKKLVIQPRLAFVAPARRKRAFRC